MAIANMPIYRQPFDFLCLASIVITLPVANRKPTRPPLMKHPDTSSALATSLALRWRCTVCGKTAIRKMSILAAVCDGDTIRKVEPEQSNQRL
jgi:hypothetical protein